MLNSIDSTDISVVVQGAIHNKFTKKSLSSIRKYLPEAEIILSTWEGTDTSNLDYDIILLNKDPGAHVFDCNGRVQNQNRQIVSTKNGIKKASRKYVLKIRSDMQIQGTKFLHFFDKYNDYNSEFKILKKRILINSLFTRYSEKTWWNDKPFLFHTSDWMMFGLKDDLLNIWDIPLAPEPETSQYFKNHPEIPHTDGCYSQYHAEQYIWLSFLRKNGFNPNYEHWEIHTDELKELNDLLLVNNTVLLEYLKEFDIINLKYPKQLGNSPTMHPIHWIQMYKKYCNKNYKMPLKYDYVNVFKINKRLEHLHKHVHNFIYPIKKFLRWFFEPASILYYIIKIALRIITRFHKLFKR